MVNTELVLHGTKIFLRKFTESDIDENYVSWLNDPDVVRYSNQRFLKHDKKTCLHYLSSFNDTGNLFLNMRTLTDDRSVGTMTAYISKHHRTVDIGIMIGDKSIWGDGYGQDAWNTLTNWLLERDDIRKLTSGTLACNTGMIKIMKNSGMHHEATRKEQEIVNDETVDILYYAKFHNT